MLDERLAVLYRNLFQVCLIFMLFVTFMVGKCGLKKKKSYQLSFFGKENMENCYEESFKHMG